MTALIVIMGLAIALLGALVIGLLRSHADVLRALHELGVDLDPSSTSRSQTLRTPVLRTRPGVAAPRPGGVDMAREPIVGITPSGGTVAVSLAPRPHATVLAFLSTGCTTCAAFWSAFQDDVDLPGEGTQVVIVTRGPEHESPNEVAGLAPPGVVTVQSSEAWARFGVPGSPYFALVDGGSGQIVGEGSATTWEHVSGLLQRAVADGGVRLGVEERSGARNLARDAAEREARIDADLASAGITPGHASLYPTSAGSTADDDQPPRHAHD